MEFNIYCDESCHLESDDHRVMVLGAVWCPTNRVKSISQNLIDIRKKNNINPALEIKWTKVSPAKATFYTDLINYFFNESDLHLRVLIIPDKSKLNHSKYNQTHDEWYYKMYFEMLKTIIDPIHNYFIYLDYKDTKGGSKVKKLYDVLANSKYDFRREILQRFQIVRSHEVQLIQLTDLLIGIIGYANRDSKQNDTKKRLVNLVQTLSGYKLTSTTLLSEKKTNIFIWNPQEV